MNHEKQFHRYLDWLEDRGLRFPAIATPNAVDEQSAFQQTGKRIYFIHTMDDLSQTHLQLAGRITTACGYEQDEFEIHQAARWNPGEVPEANRKNIELVIALGESAVRFCHAWISAGIFEDDILVCSSTLDKLASDVGAKRDLWRQLQGRQKNNRSDA